MTPLLVLLLSVLVASAPLAGEEAAAAEWETLLSEWCAAAGIPIVQAAVVEDGAIVWYGTVRAPGEEADAANPHPTFPAASLAKPVFACVVLALAEPETSGGDGEGGGDAALDLDAPIMTLLDEETRRTLPLDARFASVTPRRILSHSAGLSVGGRPVLVLDPATRFSYSGSGYDLLQRAVEARTGESLEALARRLVFEPAGMTRTTFAAGTREGEPGRPLGSDRFGERIPFRDPPRSYASFSLRTTADDYARFLVALRDGRILSESSRALLFGAEVPVDRRVVFEPGAEEDPVDGVSWGLGFGREDADVGAVAFQWGNHPGFRSYVAFEPRDGDGLVWLAGSADGLALRDAFVGAVLPGTHPAHAWLDFEAHDDPRLALSRRLGLAARDEGIAAARALHAAWLEDEAIAPLLAPSERLVGETGQLLQLSGHSAPATELLEWNAELAPDDAWAHENLARILLFTGRAEEARAPLRRCLELDPTNGFAYETLKRLDAR